MTSKMKNALWVQGASGTFSSTKSGCNYTTIEIEQQFLQVMQSARIYYSGEIIADGRLHRIHIEGHKRGSLNGAYILHLDACPAGWFMDYKTGISQTWRSGSNTRISYSLIKQIEAAKQQHEAEILKRHTEAARKADYLWSQSKPITNQSQHAYLINKGIQPHEVRLYRSALAIPIYNESDQLVNLQFINPQGEKRFLSGARKRGCFHILGDLSGKLLICEGFATGASLHEDSGQRVIVAFDAGNLLPVAKNIRELSPDGEIIICGDNDLSGVGQTKAREAALSIGGKVLIPPVPGTDWNDLIAGVCQHG